MTIADRDPIAEKRSPIAIGDLLIGDRSSFVDFLLLFCFCEDIKQNIEMVTIIIYQPIRVKSEENLFYAK